MLFIIDKYSFKKSFSMLLFLKVALLVACNGDSPNDMDVVPNDPDPSASYVGHWHAPAYGYVVSISIANALFTKETYSVTENYCLRQNLVSGLDRDDIEREYIYSHIAREVLLQQNGPYAPGIEFKRLTRLPEVCQTALQTLKHEENYQFDAKKDFEVLWQTFNELYVGFPIRGVNWDDAYQKAIASIDGIQDESALFDLLIETVSPLLDDHVVLLSAPLEENLEKSLEAAFADDKTTLYSTSRQLSLSEKLIKEYKQTLEANGELNGPLTETQRVDAEKYVDENIEKMADIIRSYAIKGGDISVRANDEIAWFKTDDNIGYLFLGAMEGYGAGRSTADAEVTIAEAIITEALNDLEDTDGLIIDVRFNDGGEDDVSLAFVRHFMRDPRVLYSKSAGKGKLKTPTQDIILNPHTGNVYLKPTVVLASRNTVSAAEVFLLAMRSLPHVTIIGEPSSGAFSDILVKRLTSDIAFGLSNETYLDVQGKNYEGIGIPVDIAVPFANLQERTKGDDRGIETAVDFIKSGEQ